MYLWLTGFNQSQSVNIRPLLLPAQVSNVLCPLNSVSSRGMFLTPCILSTCNGTVRHFEFGSRSFKEYPLSQIFRSSGKGCFCRPFYTFLIAVYSFLPNGFWRCLTSQHWWQLSLWKERRLWTQEGGSWSVFQSFWCLNSEATFSHCASTRLPRIRKIWPWR